MLNNCGGIPREEIAWLETVLGENSIMDTWEDKEADNEARRFGANYIAVCHHLGNRECKANTKAI